jgi:hypothetical protein
MLLDITDHCPNLVFLDTVKVDLCDKGESVDLRNRLKLITWEVIGN